MCPVCQEPLGQELTMLPCGHQLCVRCHMALLDRIPPNTPMVIISPPTILSIVFQPSSFCYAQIDYSRNVERILNK